MDQRFTTQWQRIEDLKASRRNASAAIVSMLCIVGMFSAIYFVFTHEGVSWWVLFFYISMLCFFVAALMRVIQVNYELKRERHPNEPVVVVPVIPPAPSYISVDLPPSYSQAFVNTLPVQDDRIPSTQTLQFRDFTAPLRSIAEEDSGQPPPADVSEAPSLMVVPVRVESESGAVDETAVQTQAGEGSNITGGVVNQEEIIRIPPNAEEEGSHVGGPQGKVET